MELSAITIEIWSDFMCPFCYMGKRKLETALAQFEHKNQVNIIWRSFQLSPNYTTDADINLISFLSARKGISIQESTDIHTQIETKALEQNLVYNTKNTVAANTYKAHQLSHLSKKYDKQNQAEEIIFRSVFTDGYNIDDENVLYNLCEELGIDKEELRKVFEKNLFSHDISADIKAACTRGIKMIPCFVINGTKIISGTYNSDTFYQALVDEYEGVTSIEKNAATPINNTESCSIDGNCS